MQCVLTFDGWMREGDMMALAKNLKIFDWSAYWMVTYVWPVVVLARVCGRRRCVV